MTINIYPWLSTANQIHVAFVDLFSQAGKSLRQFSKGFGFRQAWRVASFPAQRVLELERYRRGLA